MRILTTYMTDLYTGGELHIKVENNCNLELLPMHEFGTEKDVNRQTNWATDDLNIIADYDKNQLFAVFNKSEVMKMINCLSWALSGCDGFFNMNKLILLVFCHLVGDYVLQNDFIAKTKGSNWYHLDLTWDDPIVSNNQDILELGN